MPTEKGILTLNGNVYVTYTYEEESFKVAEASDLSVRMEETKLNAIPELQAQRKAAKSMDHKEIQQVNGDPSKTALIGDNLAPK